MSETYIQVPEDSTGKKLRAWSGSGGSHSEAVILTINDENNTFIDPRLMRISGSDATVGITGSITNTVAVTGSTFSGYVTGSVYVTGSITNTVAVSGSTFTCYVTGSGTNQAVVITGSIDRINSTVTVTPVISGSGIYTYASAVMVTGSVNLNAPLQFAISGSANAYLGNVISALSGSWKDSISSGGNIATLTLNSGSVVIPLSGTTKIKVFDLGMCPSSAGLHWFYFGTTTGSTQTKQILTCSGSGTFRQSFPYPRTSDAGDALYIYSTVAETGLQIDVSYVQE